MKRVVLAALACAFVVGCIESPQSEVVYEASALPSLASSFVVGDVSVALSRAELAFGPVYFCAATSGSATLCRSALGEITRVTTIDLLRPEAQPLGAVRGFTGTVRSASYDLGLHWFDTSFAVEPSPAAPEGHSMVVEGTLTRGPDVAVPFRLLVDAVPQYQGQRAVPTAPAATEVEPRGTRLTVAFEPERWLRQIDFDAVLRTAKRPIVLDTKSPAHDAVLVGIKVARPPEFRWSNDP